MPSPHFHVWTTARSEQRPTCIKHRKKWVETHMRLIARYSDIDAKSMRWRLKTGSLQRAVTDSAPEATRYAPATFWRRSERSRCALGRPGAVPRAFLGRPRRAFWHPWGVPAAPWSVPVVTRIAQNGPKPIFHRFFVEFWSIWDRCCVDFSFGLRRC